MTTVLKPVRTKHAKRAVKSPTQKSSHGVKRAEDERRESKL